VRTIYIHHFFQNTDDVDDTELLPLIEQTMDRDTPRAWFNALMDYGTDLKEQFPNPSRKSAQYAKQKPLKGSVREVRGWIMKQLVQNKQVSLAEIQAVFDEDRTQKAITGLVKDCLITEQKGTYLLK